MSIENRLKAVEIALVRLTDAITQNTEAHYATLRRVTVPTEDELLPRRRKPVKPKTINMQRLTELAERYERVKGQDDFNILLRVFNIETLAKLERKEYKKFYEQMLSELHVAIEH